MPRPTPNFRRLAKLALCTVVAVYLCYLVAVYLLQPGILFPGAYEKIPGARESFNTRVHPGWERLERRGADGTTVVAWYWPPPDAAGAPALAVLLHGNFETAPSMQPEATFYRQQGMAVLVPEFRGYAGSQGKPDSQDLIVGDVTRWRAAVLERPELAGAKTLIHGRSVGGLVAAQTARERAPDALVLESTGHSVAELSWRVLAPPFLVRFPFRTGEALAQGDYPTLIVHGTQDEVFPPSHAKANARDAHGRATLILVEKGMHNTTQMPWAELGKFLVKSGIR